LVVHIVSHIGSEKTMPATPIPLVMESTEAVRATAADGASKLAANVNAAAEALDDLKRLLRRQFPDSIPTRLQTADGVPQAPVAPLVPAELMPAAGQEPRRLNIPCFLAGCASSAVIGVLVYIFLGAG
jgi:hypothetical protein